MSKLEDLAESVDVAEFGNKMEKLKVLNRQIIERDTKTLPKEFFNFSVYKNEYNVEDLGFSTTEEKVEEFIEKEIERTRPYDHEFQDRPNKISDFFNFSTNVPNVENIKKETAPKLISFTTLGRIENGTMLPKEEANYLSDLFKKSSTVGEKVSENEVVLRVAFYHPVHNNKTEEFLVLGGQLLTTLKDKVYCLCDHIVKEQFQSNYFFIENTFYNDTRKSDKVLSQEVIDFANESKPRLRKPLFSNLQQKKMEVTRFRDLKIKIGKRYMYCHKGCCKHYMIFLNARIINSKSDDVYVQNYPKKVFQCRIKRKKCHVCEIFPARVVTLKNKYSPINPTFWCNNCYKSFFFDEKGNQKFEKKDLEIHRYFHD